MKIKKRGIKGKETEKQKKERQSDREAEKRRKGKRERQKGERDVTAAQNKQPLPRVERCHLTPSVFAMLESRCLPNRKWNLIPRKNPSWIYLFSCHFFLIQAIRAMPLYLCSYLLLCIITMVSKMREKNVGYRHFYLSKGEMIGK